MLKTTTSRFENKNIVQYIGIVSGQAILGTNFVKDFFADVSDFIGGRSGTYEKELSKARDIALEQIEKKAYELGANGIVGIDLDYEVLGKENGMLMVSANGTAVVIE